MRRRLRLRQFDYRNASTYFVTICAADRRGVGRERFGTIGPSRWNPEVPVFRPNDIGEIAADCWINVPGHFPSVMIDEFAVLPDHFHGILFFEARAPEGTRAAANGYSRSRSPTLGIVVGSFKSAVSRESACIRPPGKLWQRGFHDRIVRNYAELTAIRRYIGTNVSTHAPATIV